MKNEPIAVRAVLGLVLGLLVQFGVLPWAPEQVQSVLSQVDMALPLLIALVGAISARSQVDGPKTVAAKDKFIEGLLEAEVMRNRPSYPPAPAEGP